MAEWDIEIHRQVKMGDRVAFDIWFSVDGQRRSFSLAIVDATLARWEDNAQQSFDEDTAVLDLARALLINGADSSPHEGYLFDDDAAPTVEETLRWVGEKGLEQFAAPEEPADN
jgi:hypothetical protein